MLTYDCFMISSLQVKAILPSKIHFINSTQTFIENYNMLNPELQTKYTVMKRI